MAICGEEEAYTLRLAEYFSSRPGLPFEVQAFSSPEVLAEYVREHPVDVLLIAEGMLSEELEQAGIERTILLTEEPEAGDGEYPGERDGEYPKVYKYQPGGQLLQEVLACCAKKEGSPAAAWGGKGTVFYGVYSPIGRCGKTGFALMLGQVLAEEGRVLYLNFEEYAGFSTLLAEENADMSELLVHLLQEWGSLYGRLQELVRPLGRIEYIPPGVCHADLRQLEWEHWERLLESIREEQVYDAVILDLGSAFDALFPILERCDAVYVPVLEDAVSRAKLEQFCWVCEGSGTGGLQSRLHRVQPPREDFWEAIRGGEPENSELYGYVKEVLKEEGRIHAGTETGGRAGTGTGGKAEIWTEDYGGIDTGTMGA